LKFLKAVVPTLLQLVFPGAGLFYIGETRFGCIMSLGYIFSYFIVNLIALYTFWLALALATGLVVVNLALAGHIFKKVFYGHTAFNRTRYVITFIAVYIAIAGTATQIKWNTAFYIPSTSMVPTLLVGDRVYVNIHAFDSHDPIPGDLVVLRYPKNQNIIFIKRVIAVPGDKVAWENESATVNGVRLKIESAHDPNEAENLMASYEEREGLKFANESIGGHDHRIAWNAGFSEEKGEIQVPEGQFFVLGDFRTRSYDSRRFGTVDRSLLIGKPTMVFWSNARDYHPRFERIGEKIN
jgi:signal peptidase I